MSRRTAKNNPSKNDEILSEALESDKGSKQPSSKKESTKLPEIDKKSM